MDKIYTKNGKIDSIKLMNGEEIECKILVMAIGVTPDTSFITKGDLKTGRGILVDERMQASKENIYAAGDIIEGFDKLLGESRGIAIWPLAVKQGIVAGANMAGEEKKYSGGFFMNSVEILGTPSISLGITNIEEDEASGIEIIREYRPLEKRYKKIVIRDNKIIGAIMVGNIERAGIYAGLIENEVNLTGVKENILKEDFGIIHLPADYKKHLVVGEGVEV
ncbi:NADH-dependent phenylglyoxylate dehydrogenase subunit epsilon [subsurface metagenome]